MPSVIEVRSKSGIPDVRGERTRGYINDVMGVPVGSVGTRTLYYFSDEIGPEQARQFGDVLLADSVVEDHRFLGDAPVYEQPQVPANYRGSWLVRVGYKRKPLIIDNWGEATRRALNRIFDAGLESVRKIDEYEIRGDLNRKQIDKICSEEKLADSKVQTHICIPLGEGNG
jgi:phosphoribosylformylglycinamidine (FGAM) synthase PurS component